jgi:hypothetical protein
VSQSGILALRSHLVVRFVENAVLLGAPIAALLSYAAVPFQFLPSRSVDPLQLTAERSRYPRDIWFVVFAIAVLLCFLSCGCSFIEGLVDANHAFNRTRRFGLLFGEPAAPRVNPGSLSSSQNQAWKIAPYKVPRSCHCGAVARGSDFAG